MPTIHPIVKVARELMPHGKVLVVDDMKSNLDVARLLLSPYKLHVDIAESGFETLDIIKSGKVYDIVFMDHMMPEMDGIETVKKIRQLGYKHPILALTAETITGQREMFLTNGFDGFISKPIDIRQLDDSLNRFVKKKEQPPAKKIDLPAETMPGLSGKKEKAPIQIPGVNSEMGLALYGEDMDIYVAVLRAFIPNALTVIDKMRNVTAETLPGYAINVHGLKGISAGIGAGKISEAAQILETMAKSGDLAGVLAGNEALLKDTEKIVSRVQVWFDQFDGENPKPLLPCPDRTLLARLRKSCEAYDMNGIDDVMDELESANYETDAPLVTWLREKIDELEFSAVASRLSTYEDGSK